MKPRKLIISAVFCIFVQMQKSIKYILSIAFTMAIFSFWMWLYPAGLNYHEQNQLFLWTWSYLLERISVSGGLADWFAEFLVQFFRIRWAGAAVMAILAVAMQAATLSAAGKSKDYYFFSFFPPVLWTVACGDMEFLISLPVAIIAALFLCRPFEKAGLHKIWAAPLLWWMIGPVSFIPVLYSFTAKRNWKEIGLAVWSIVAVYVLYRLFLMQYTPRDVAFGINYYRVAEELPRMQISLPLAAFASICFIRWVKAGKVSAVINPLLSIALIAGGWFGTKATYNVDNWELIAYSALERDSNFTEIIKRAEKYQPRSVVGATYVNYALAMDGKLESRMFDFFQDGTKGLIMPSVRDNMSDIASCDILWMIGMTNMSLQYAFDLQESIQNGRKSGRFTSRISECHIVNGHYELARRYLNKLTNTIFYRKWALDRLAMIDRRDEGVDTDPIYRYLRRAGFQTDFIANYDSLDLMMALLYRQNDTNLAAVIYFNAWQKLKQAEQQNDEKVSDTGAHGS